MSDKKEYTIIEIFNDNGSYSHSALVEFETGIKVWSENPEECKAMGYPVRFSKPDNNEIERLKAKFFGEKINVAYDYELWNWIVTNCIKY